MTSKKLKIGIDFDDILMDFQGSFYSYINSLKNTSYSISDVTDFRIENILGCSRQEALDFIADFYQTGEHVRALPIKGSQQAIKKLSENYSLFIISSRPEYLREKTESWIQENFGNVFEKIYLNNQYHGEGIRKTKAEVCEEIGVEVYIEDFMPNAIQVADSGRKVFLLDNPWNQEPAPENIMRVFSWDEISETLEVTEDKKFVE